MSAILYNHVTTTIVRRLYGGLTEDVCVFMPKNHFFRTVSKYLVFLYVVLMTTHLQKVQSGLYLMLSTIGPLFDAI